MEVEDLSHRVTAAETIAQAAANRIDSHEKVCSIRYEGINKGIGELKGILKWLVGLLIASLLAITAWLYQELNERTKDRVYGAEFRGLVEHFENEIKNLKK